MRATNECESITAGDNSTEQEVADRRDRPMMHPLEVLIGKTLPATFTASPSTVESMPMERCGSSRHEAVLVGFLLQFFGVFFQVFVDDMTFLCAHFLFF
jgi:hypothetical protein